MVLAVDGSNRTFWNNGLPIQWTGHWFSIDLGSIQDVSGITLDSTADPANYLRRFTINTSVDGGNFTTWASVDATGPVTHIDFARHPVRWVTVLSGGFDGASWSIDDFDVCNNPSASTQ